MKNWIRSSQKLCLELKRNAGKEKTGYLWSIKLAHAARITRYWKSWKQDSLNKRAPSDALLRLGNLNIKFTNLSPNKIASHLTNARLDLKKAKKNAATLRDKYLEEMAKTHITS
eukprot:5372512-Ditylum_brightwellii.AAC.1